MATPLRPLGGVTFSRSTSHMLLDRTIHLPLSRDVVKSGDGKWVTVRLKLSGENVLQGEGTNQMNEGLNQYFDG